MLVAVASLAISDLVAGAILIAILFGAIPYFRVQYLKSHPPDPELAHKPFWKL